MPDQTKLVTVFRSADHSAEDEAIEIHARLVEAGIEAVVVDDDAPGVVEGTWEVRVPATDAPRAEGIIGAPLPEPEDESEVDEEGQSADLDFVPIYSGQGAEAEMEAISIRSALEASGIPCVVIGSQQIPSLPFEVRVPKSRVEEARALLEEAQSSSATDTEGA